MREIVVRCNCAFHEWLQKSLDRIWDSTFFAIMIDETMDIFITSHFVVFVSFVDDFYIIKARKKHV